MNHHISCPRCAPFISQVSGHDSYATNPVSLNHRLTKKTPRNENDRLIRANLLGGGHQQPFQKVTFSLTIPKRSQSQNCQVNYYRLTSVYSFPVTWASMFILLSIQLKLPGSLHCCHVGQGFLGAFLLAFQPVGVKQHPNHDARYTRVSI